MARVALQACVMSFMFDHILASQRSPGIKLCGPLTLNSNVLFDCFDMVKGVLEGRVLCDRWGWYIMEQIKSVQIQEYITVCTI